jgi:hypothetical protein
MQVEALRRADPPSKESCRLCTGSRNWKSGQGPTKGCRAIIIRQKLRHHLSQCFSTAGARPGTGPSSYRKKNLPGRGLTKLLSRHLRGRTEGSYAFHSARTPAVPTEIQIGHPASISVNNNNNNNNNNKTSWTALFRFPALQDFCLLYSIQTGSEAHPPSYPMDIGGSFPGGKAAGAWSWPLTSI